MSADAGHRGRATCRTLHLVRGDGLRMLACAHETMREPWAGVILLGTRAGAGRLTSLGVRPAAVIAPPLGVLPLAVPMVRSRFREAGLPDRLVAWDEGLAVLARAALVDPARIDTVLPGDRRLTELPPPARLPEAERLAVRRGLGIDDHDAVFVAAGEPAAALDAFEAVRTLSLLDVAGRRVVALVPRGSWRLDRARWFHRNVGLSMGMIIRETPWWEDAAWADGALLFPSEDWRAARGLPARAWAADHGALTSVLVRMGVPTLALREHAARWGLPEHPNLIVGSSPGHAALAKRVLASLDRIRQSPIGVRYTVAGGASNHG